MIEPQLTMAGNANMLGPACRVWGIHMPPQAHRGSQPAGIEAPANLFLPGSGCYEVVPAVTDFLPITGNVARMNAGVSPSRSSRPPIANDGAEKTRRRRIASESRGPTSDPGRRL